MTGPDSADLPVGEPDKPDRQVVESEGRDHRVVESEGRGGGVVESEGSDRRVVVVVVPAAGTWAPPGRDPEAWRLAMAEDTYEVIAALDRVDVAVAVAGDENAVAEVRALTWPGTPTYAVDP